MFSEVNNEKNGISSNWYKLSLKMLSILFPICFLSFVGLTVYAFIRTGSGVVGCIVLVFSLIVDIIFILCIIYCAKSYKKAVIREKEIKNEQNEK